MLVASIRALSLALALLAPACVLAQAAPGGCPGQATPPGPPDYPPALLKAGVGGTTVLLMTIDDCGEVVAASVEKPSGHPELDAAAMKAARTWHFNPGTGKGPHVVRVPIDFDPSQAASAEPAPDPEAWGSPLPYAMQHLPTPTLTAAGKVPGYVPDPLPLDVPSVAAAKIMVEKRHPEKQTQQGLDTYTVSGADGLSIWQFTTDGPWHPSVWRTRIVDDGSRGFGVTAFRCEADAAACRSFENFVKSMSDQPDLPPPPPPPSHG